ncbi:MAG: hypothetical protein SPJ55_12820 [Treponema sp.]|nr:hypothetical protein [Treponema sp.]MDY5919279.1 hypothetical protein [Treponema sp.]
MTRLEIANVLNDIMIENNFSIIDRDNCHKKYSDKINSMQEIFHLKSSSDYTYLYAISHLLSNKEKSVDDYLISENKDSTLAKDVKLPTRDDLLLVATAFEENPEFFSMAWNWTVITEDRINSIINELRLYDYSSEQEISDELHKRIGYQLVVEGTDFGILVSFNLNYPNCTLNFSDGNTIVLDIKKSQQNDTSSKNIIINFTYSYDKQIDELKYAASGTHDGWGENITKIPVGNLGELKILGDSDTQQIVVDFFVSEECQTLQFELTVEFDVNGESLIAVLRKESSNAQAVITSDPIDYDFVSTLKLKNISCKPL